MALVLYMTLNIALIAQSSSQDISVLDAGDVRGNYKGEVL